MLIWLTLAIIVAHATLLRLLKRNMGSIADLRAKTEELQISADGLRRDVTDLQERIANATDPTALAEIVEDLNVVELSLEETRAFVRATLAVEPPVEPPADPEEPVEEI